MKKLCFCLVLVLCAMARCARAQPTSRPAAEAGLSITAPSVIVRGFPALLKITAVGPQSVPPFSVLTNRGTVEITLYTKDNVPARVMHQRTQAAGIVSGPFGRMENPDPELVDVPAGETQTMLCDMWSLDWSISGGETKDSLADLGPGKYELEVFLPATGRSSNRVQIEWREPSKNEQEFLEALSARIRTTDKQTSSATNHETAPGDRESRINWVFVLRRPVFFEDLDIAKLRPETRNQLAFHIFLSRILNPARPVKEWDPTNLWELETIAVPDYLTPEKNSVLLEIEVLNKGIEAVQGRVDEWLKNNPGLQWRIDDATKNWSDFLETKRVMPRKR